MATIIDSDTISDLVINKVPTQAVFDNMIAQGQVNDDELYLIENDATGIFGADADVLAYFNNFFAWDSTLASISRVRITKAGSTVSMYLDFIPATSKSSTYSLRTASSIDLTHPLCPFGCPCSPVFDANNNYVGYLYFLAADGYTPLNVRLYPNTTINANAHYYTSMIYVSTNSNPLS